MMGLLPTRQVAILKQTFLDTVILVVRCLPSVTQLEEEIRKVGYTIRVVPQSAFL